MRLRIASVLTATALAVGAFMALGGAAGAARSPQAKFTGHIRAPHVVNKGYCNTTGDAINDGIVSQNFEATFDAFDSMGAADCNIGRRAKTIHQIVAPGVYFNGYGPAVSENVIAYANASGLPGAVKNSQTVAGADAAGTFTIPLTPYKVKGKVWFTVQANMDFYSGGEWGWDTTTAAEGKFGDQWINPGGGFGLGTNWQPVGNLDGSSVSFLYAIS